jgi:hypothetical protein
VKKALVYTSNALLLGVSGFTFHVPLITEGVSPNIMTASLHTVAATIAG